MRLVPLTVIYDGNCGFCIRSLSVVRALDTRGVCRYVAVQTAGLTERFPELHGADFGEAMFVVDGSGRVYRGFFGFRRIARRLPLAWPLLAVFYLPGAGIVGPAVYRWVARNRFRFGCGETCSTRSGMNERR